MWPWGRPDLAEGRVPRILFFASRLKGARGGSLAPPWLLQEDYGPAGAECHAREAGVEASGLRPRISYFVARISKEVVRSDASRFTRPASQNRDPWPGAEGRRQMEDIGDLDRHKRTPARVPRRRFWDALPPRDRSAHTCEAGILSANRGHGRHPRHRSAFPHVLNPILRSPFPIFCLLLDRRDSTMRWIGFAVLADSCAL